MTLSPRQRQIILGAAHGKTDKELAGELKISEGTVGDHWREIFRKLCAKTRAHAVYLWAR